MNMKWKPAALRPPLLPLSPLSPLSSPTLGALPAKLRNRIPSGIRRTFPVYLVIIIAIFFLLKVDVFPTYPAPPPLSKRWALQKPLRSSSSSTTQKPLTEFPKKIWQTWKTDPFNFAQRDSDTAKTWTAKNPGHRYEVLTDNNDLLYVEEKYGPNGLDRPDIVWFYRSVTTTIIKADLLRYMIMYADGGVYADIDVEALKPADRFIPTRYHAADVDMVIGVEIDQPEFKDHPILGQKSMSFCQWTFMCKPRLPVMLQLIENIMEWLTDIAAKQNVSISDVQLDFDEVISGTGPSAFTAAILKDMNKSGGKKVTWDMFHALDESVVVNRVLVLDVEKFAAGQGHSDSGNHNARGALVKHHYHASNWPSKHPRYKHPAYGEVEQCNWNKACVDKWDQDVAAWETLSEEGKNKILDEKRAELERKMEEAKREQEKAAALERLGQAAKKREQEARKKAKAAAKKAQAGAGGHTDDWLSFFGS
ncbi:family 32 putative glycosyltransferase [Podospora australis]|uniref:Family 32 putative glycosyltransferase n=1 Tax=Podospora australis TaxID=1536484 RepID=A0AAN7AF58_9PEZI|nr:family 32 putative glycosyltransferase [Podospora australis]